MKDYPHLKRDTIGKRIADTGEVCEDVTLKRGRAFMQKQTRTYKWPAGWVIDAKGRAMNLKTAEVVNDGTLIRVLTMKDRRAGAAWVLVHLADAEPTCKGVGAPDPLRSTLAPTPRLGITRGTGVIRG